MRSPAEIRFRLRQEAANVALWLRPPGLREIPSPGPLAPLPDPGAVAVSLKDTPYRDRVRATAERVMRGCVPVLGFEVETGKEIHWRRDALSGIETPLEYFRHIPYLDVSRAGDHKVIWELSRHQHLVLLAQEYCFSRERRFVDEIVRQLESWWADNPFQRGMNWTSALEVAFRALSWCWIWHLVSRELTETFRARFATELYRHGLHLEYNLSVYFSPNTHLLGEAVALHAIGRLFPELPRSRRWVKLAGSIIEEQIQRQVRDDGSHFEQSAYYHVYATDMFLFHALIAETTAGYRERLARMADYLESLIGPNGLLPMFGDDDGGRFFDPYSDRRTYALETLAVFGRGRDARHGWSLASWWGTLSGADAPRELKLTLQSGMVIEADGVYQVLFDAGPFGPGSGGHSHADTLSVIVRRGPEEILIDPGTYTYVGDPEWRNRFRGTAMHNTVRIDGLDQAEPGTPFSWLTKPEVRMTGPWAGECAHRGFVHRRSIEREGPAKWIINDEIEGPVGEHLLEQFWHPGCPTKLESPHRARIGKHCTLTIKPTDAFESTEGGEFGWRSPVLGVREPAPVLRVRRTTALPASFRTELNLEAD